MYRSRRSILTASLGSFAGLCLWARSNVRATQGSTQMQNPPNPRRDGNPEDAPLPAGANTKALLEQRQKDIKKEIEKLYDLATQLKNDVEKTDATSVLSIGMVRKAEEIEKLARQIKDHAKGS
jgi:hypothetical protein